MKNKLNELLNELESSIQNHEKINLTISNSAIAWHIEHALLVINSIITALSKSDTKTYKRKFNFLRMIVLFTKKIPRGKGKAPERVQPKTTLNAESLLNHIAQTREKIQLINDLDKNSFFEHPIFGCLKFKETIRFLEIHTQHHLLIIKDINKA